MIAVTGSMQMKFRVAAELPGFAGSGCGLGA